jgi:hypothetical protein
VNKQSQQGDINFDKKEDQSQVHFSNKLNLQIEAQHPKRKTTHNIHSEKREIKVTFLKNLVDLFLIFFIPKLIHSRS